MLELGIAVQTRVPVLVWGGPGVGKSSYIESLGAALDLPVEVVIASIREPSDFAGLPIIHGDSVTLAAPVWARRLAEAGRGIAFLDELTTAPPAVQAALLRVVLDRVVGELALPDAVGVVAAANQTDMAAGGWELAPPLANRLCHLDWHLDARAWADGMIAGWPAPEVRRLPANWRELIPIARAIVASFITAKPTLLYHPPKAESEQGRAWPSPRSWDRAGAMLAACRSLGLKDDSKPTAKLVAGCVGEGATLELLNWLREMDLPDPELVLADPAKLVLPKRGDRAHAILSSVAAAVIARNTVDRWRAGCAVMGKAADDGHVDVAVPSVRALVRNAPAGTGAPRDLARFRPVLEAAGLLG